MDGLLLFDLICYIVAFICLVAEALSLGRNPRLSLGWLGLAAWVLVPLVTTIHDASH